MNENEIHRTVLLLLTARNKNKHDDAFRDVHDIIRYKPNGHDACRSSLMVSKRSGQMMPGCRDIQVEGRRNSNDRIIPTHAGKFWLLLCIQILFWGRFQFVFISGCFAHLL